MIKKIDRFFKDFGGTVVGLILSLGLFITFLKQFADLSNELFPGQRNSVTVGAGSSQGWVDWLNGKLNTEPLIIVMLVLTITVFIIEIGILVYKIAHRKPVIGD